MTTWHVAHRLHNLPPYLFAELERMVERRKRKGLPTIDLGVGDPDLQPPAFLIESLKRHLDEPDVHLYPTSRGDVKVRESIAKFFAGRYRVELDPEYEIAVVIGAKEGLANLTRAFVNPGDVVAVPSPCYPVYHGAGAILNEGTARDMLLHPDRGMLPDLSDVEGARLVFLNYPNNPTGAEAPVDFFQSVADFADNNPETVVVHDAAYAEMTFGGIKSPSLLQFSRNAIEFHSMSKTLNATGYRIGFAVGAPELIDGLVRIKAQLDSGAPLFIQRAMADALERFDGTTPPREVQQAQDIYGKRRQVFQDGLESLGYQVHRSNATFYVWFKVSGDDAQFVEKALQKGVVLTPGRGFGGGGAGWVRATMTQPEDQLYRALELLSKL
jgi:LL-diaminopimelate aminotransferase